MLNYSVHKYPGHFNIFFYLHFCELYFFLCRRIHNTVVSNHFHSVKILLFSSARSRDFDGMFGTELPVSMYTTKTPIDMCRFNVRSSTYVKTRKRRNVVGIDMIRNNRIALLYTYVFSL